MGKSSLHCILQKQTYPVFFLVRRGFLRVCEIFIHAGVDLTQNPTLVGKGLFGLSINVTFSSQKTLGELTNMVNYGHNMHFKDSKQN